MGGGPLGTLDPRKGPQNWSPKSEQKIFITPLAPHRCCSHSWCFKDGVSVLVGPRRRRAISGNPESKVTETLKDRLRSRPLGLSRSIAGNEMRTAPIHWLQFDLCFRAPSFMGTSSNRLENVRTRHNFHHVSDWSQLVRNTHLSEVNFHSVSGDGSGTYMSSPCWSTPT